MSVLVEKEALERMIILTEEKLKRYKKYSYNPKKIEKLLQQYLILTDLLDEDQ